MTRPGPSQTLSQSLSLLGSPHSLPRDRRTPGLLVLGFVQLSIPSRSPAWVAMRTTGLSAWTEAAGYGRVRKALLGRPAPDD